MDSSSVILSRIENLRDVMKKNNLAAVIVPQADPHGSEYVADHWQLRRFMSGFTGSAGPLVVTLTGAWVIADSRYWLQAAAQLADTGIDVVEAGKPGAPTLEELLLRELKSGDTVGIDGQLISASAFSALSSALVPAGISLVATPDLVGPIWSDRPELPRNPIEVHELAYAGEAAPAKLRSLRDAIRAAGADSAFVADLAKIAWLLNIRSTDVDCNPVVISYLYMGECMTLLFVDEARLDDEIRGYLAYIGVATAPYSVAATFLTGLPADEKIAADASELSQAMAEAIGPRLIDSELGINEAKAMRNEVQIAGTRAAMERDGAALVKGFKEIEERVAARTPTDEIDVDAILTARRSEQPLFKMLSFETIAGYGPNGAIVHYTAMPGTAAALAPSSLLLVDSGASYLDGTTDITRTIALGEPTDEMRRDYTDVLRGNIALASAVFPEGTRGAQLDALARIPMWRHGAHYLHGTGHGVGHYLNVHEGPQSIRLQENPQPIRPGMVTSDEPGIYRAGKYGIRLENLLLAVKAFDDPDYGPFMRFETLTLYPFDSRLIDVEALTPDELDWLNGYHAEVLRRLTPLLTPDEAAWLAEKCKPLTRKQCL